MIKAACILVSKAGAQYMGFFGLSPDLKMRACSGVVLVKYHRHLRALWRQDTLRDCRKNQKMAILAISHVMKSTGYEHQNHRFRVFRQSQPKSILQYHLNLWLTTIFCDFSATPLATHTYPLKTTYHDRLS